MVMIVTVIGARRGVGLKCVQRLLEKKEVTEIRAMVRDQSVISDDLFPKDDRIKIVEGDVTDVNKLRKVLNGATHAIFAAAAKHKDLVSDVDERGMKNTMEAAEAEGLGRISICSSQLVDPVNGWNFVRMLLNGLVVKGIMDAKFRGEEHVRALAKKSNVEYSIVRPGGLIDGEIGGSGKIVVGQVKKGGLKKATSSTRADVAGILIESLTNEKTKNKTFQMAGVKKEKAATCYNNLFDELVEDSEWV